MSTPYIGEIRMTGFNFAPTGWALCNGQLMAIAQNETLFAIIGTTYGGDGVNTFALPDLRDRVPMHTGAGKVIGMQAGEAAHTLTLAETPAHSHNMMTSTAASHVADPTGKTFGNVEAGALNTFHAADGSATLAPSSLGMAGGNQPHDNEQPSLTINFVIALEGIFPSMN